MNTLLPLVLTGVAVLTVKFVLANIKSNRALNEAKKIAGITSETDILTELTSINNVERGHVVKFGLGIESLSKPDYLLQLLSSAQNSSVTIMAAYKLAKLRRFSELSDILKKSEKSTSNEINESIKLYSFIHTAQGQSIAINTRKFPFIATGIFLGTTPMEDDQIYDTIRVLLTDFFDSQYLFENLFTSVYWLWLSVILGRNSAVSDSIDLFTSTPFIMPGRQTTGVKYSRDTNRKAELDYPPILQDSSYIGFQDSKVISLTLKDIAKITKSEGKYSVNYC